MSNRIHLNAVKFEYLKGDVTYGYTISDDEDMSFDNNAEVMIEDDLELLRYAKKTADASTEAMLDFMQENEKGILINDSWYDWDEIKQVWED
jgi:hypothetical protein